MIRRPFAAGARAILASHTGRGAAWQRACFGSRRSRVQIPAPRWEKQLEMGWYWERECLSGLKSDPCVPVSVPIFGDALGRDTAEPMPRDVEFDTNEFSNVRLAYAHTSTRPKESPPTRARAHRQRPPRRASQRLRQRRNPGDSADARTHAPPFIARSHISGLSRFALTRAGGAQPDHRKVVEARAVAE